MAINNAGNQRAFGHSADELSAWKIPQGNSHENLNHAMRYCAGSQAMLSLWPKYFQQLASNTANATVPTVYLAARFENVFTFGQAKKSIVYETFT